MKKLETSFSVTLSVLKKRSVFYLQRLQAEWESYQHQQILVKVLQGIVPHILLHTAMSRCRVRVVLACRTIQYTADTCVISLYGMNNKSIVCASEFETEGIFWKTSKRDNNNTTSPPPPPPFFFNLQF